MAGTFSESNNMTPFVGFCAKASFLLIPAMFLFYRIYNSVLFKWLTFLFFFLFMALGDWIWFSDPNRFP